MSPAELQARLDRVLAPSEGEPEASAFSPFVGDGVSLAGALAQQMRDAAQALGLEAALAVAEQARAGGSQGVVQNAVKLFVTHEPLARGTLILPAVEALETTRLVGRPPASRPPNFLPPGVPGAPPGDGHDVGGPPLRAAPPPTDQPDGDAQAIPSLTEPPEERALDWYREDPFANDHHAHWHIVYPRSGRGVERMQRRHGELFFYMHEQMLARYDTERVVAGLKRVKPHPPRDQQGRPDYGAEIPEGYGSEGYTTRPPGRSFAELQGAVDRHAATYEVIRSLVEAGDFEDSGDVLPVTEALLGAASEVAALNTGERIVDVETMEKRFGNLHGSGHGSASALGEGPDPRKWGGAMAWTETAICDPFFYRWHKHVDDVNVDFQNMGGERNNLESFAPEGIAFGDAPAVALILSRDIPGAGSAGFDFDRYGKEVIGPDWSNHEPPRTDQLVTRFVRSLVTAGIPRPEAADPEQVSYWTTHLEHEPFTYLARLENSTASAKRVTVRTFLAHEKLALDRRGWIELDKFEASLEPGVNIVTRPDARSSVIRRRGVEAPGAEPLDAVAEDQWCDCGWPYSLLIPSGSSDPEGSPFKLMLAVTDHEKDREPNYTATCGSMSYCGALENYPDLRRMGYPFDRPFKAPILETIAATPSMTLMDVWIRCENERPQE